MKKFTTELLYMAMLQTLPKPVVVHNNPEKDWKLKWERINSGTLNQESKSLIYLIVHEIYRVGNS